MPSVTRVKIFGKDAIVAYVNDDFEPVEPNQATLMKLIFEDGGTMWARPVMFDKWKKRPGGIKASKTH